MSREELKRMWFNIPTSEVVTKTILVEYNRGHVTITRDGPNGFSEYKTWREYPLQYVFNCVEYKSGEYKLVIK